MAVLRLQGAGARLQRAVVLYQTNQIAAAAALCAAILRDHPGQLEALQLLGNAQLQLGRAAEALESYERALRQRPQAAELLYNRGNALQRLGRFDEAVASYERALAVKPQFAQCLCNRGAALLELGRVDDALRSYDAALAYRPEYPRALNNRGLALLRRGRPQEAVSSLSRALQLQPKYAAAWSNLGSALCALRRLREALASVERALQIAPQLPEALVQRGVIGMELGRHEAALVDFRRALELEPESSMAQCFLASALLKLGRLEEAEPHFARLMQRQPEVSFACGDLLSCRLDGCRWAQLSQQQEQVLAAIAAGRCAIRPFHLLSVSDSAAAQRDCARIFAAHSFPAAAQPLWRGERYGHERIRVAYLSADFREHPVSYLMAGVFEAHDRARFELLAVSLGADDRSATALRVRRAFDELIEARDRSDQEIASLIREREIDIVVDLKGFTDEPRTVLAYRPAPIHVNYLGFPGTLGSSCYDYILADEFVIPRARRGDYAEQVVYLPDCFQANDAVRQVDALTPARRDHGLPEASVVLASFSHCHKIVPAMFDVWMRLLHALPGSVLWLCADSAAARANLAREALARGIAASRLVFAARLPYPRHLARLGLADLCLDTLPFNGGTTVSDALWAGVPVVTCAGEAFAARMAGSLLRTVGLPDLVTANLAEYEARALALASNPAVLAALRERLRHGCAGSPLFDTARFCRHLEAAYITMWQRAERGEPPVHFAVPAA